ncbi:MAG TPA: cytidylate kinase family protein, partial [Stellaceae bacterium]|nr:cytidylate kinase family protein [Stellaceae bacterium]
PLTAKESITESHFCGTATTPSKPPKTAPRMPPIRSPRLSQSNAIPLGPRPKPIDSPRSAREDRAMKREIVTIAGSPGSGKSSTAKALAASLGFRHFSSGDIFRQLAAERGLSIEAMNISAELQRDIDLRVDNLLQQLYAQQDRLVIDSRMAWHWMPESFRVFLILDPATAAERVFAQVRGAGRMSEDAASLDEMRRSIERRATSEQKRYAALYGVNATEPLNFDLVINTKYNGLDAVTAIVRAAYQAWQGGDAAD